MINYRDTTDPGHNGAAHYHLGSEFSDSYVWCYVSVMIRKFSDTVVSDNYSLIDMYV